MREHVHFAKHPFDDCLGRCRMRENRPIGPGNLAPLDRVIPQRADGGLIPCLRKLIEGTFVQAVEGFLKVLCPCFRVTRKHNPQLMHAMIIGGFCTCDNETAQDAPEFSSGKARSDNGAVQAVMELPYPGPVSRYPGHVRLGAQARAASRPDRCNVRRERPRYGVGACPERMRRKNVHSSYLRIQLP
jgi:hypothetical protein